MYLNLKVERCLTGYAFSSSGFFAYDFEGRRWHDFEAL